MHTHLFIQPFDHSSTQTNSVDGAHQFYYYRTFQIRPENDTSMHLIFWPKISVLAFECAEQPVKSQRSINCILKYHLKMLTLPNRWYSVVENVPNVKYDILLIINWLSCFMHMIDLSCSWIAMVGFFQEMKFHPSMKRRWFMVICNMHTLNWMCMKIVSTSNRKWLAIFFFHKYSMLMIESVSFDVLSCVFVP